MSSKLSCPVQRLPGEGFHPPPSAPSATQQTLHLAPVRPLGWDLLVVAAAHVIRGAYLCFVMANHSPCWWLERWALGILTVCWMGVVLGEGRQCSWGSNTLSLMGAAECNTGAEGSSCSCCVPPEQEWGQCSLAASQGPHTVHDWMPPPLLCHLSLFGWALL